MIICSACTTNVHLKNWIEAHAEGLGVCDSCGADRQHVIEVEKFVEHVDEGIRKHFAPDEEGEAPTSLISRTAGISIELARLVTDVIRPGESSGRSFYDYGPLSTAGRWPEEYLSLWRELKTIVKHEARFLGAETRSILDALLGGLSTVGEGRAVRELTPNDVVFRGRLARSRSEADEWFRAPQANLNAPPAGKASAGRMNASGVRVFYGALQERISVAELRPPIGSLVVIGSFAPTRSLRVLDLGALSERLGSVDLFSPDYEEVSARRTFLGMLEDEISLPIQPHDQELEYIPTQLIADYVRLALGLDGVAYRSAQVGNSPSFFQVWEPAEPNERNVVLFGSAAVTTSETVPEGNAGLTFVQNSQQLLEIMKIEVSYRQDTWAHYPNPSADGEDA